MATEYDEAGVAADPQALQARGVEDHLRIARPRVMGFHALWDLVYWVGNTIIHHLNANTMALARLEEKLFMSLSDEVSALQAAEAAAGVRLATEIQALDAKIAAGSAVTQADLDGIKAVTTALGDPTFGQPPAAPAAPPAAPAGP